MSKDYIIQKMEEKRDLLQSAIDRGGNLYNFDYVLEQVLIGKMQLFISDDSIAITLIQHYPEKDVLHGLFAAGNLETIMGTIQEQIIAFGRKNGCELLRMNGRAGWKRVLKDDGWHEQDTTLHKKI